MSTCAEADQLVSTGLYASLGLAPREPIYLLRGELDASVLPALPPGLTGWSHRPGRARASLEVLGSLDLASGLPRVRRTTPSGRRRASRLVVRGGGELLGYGYAHPGGRIGPVSRPSPDLLPAMLGHLVRHVPVLEGRQVVVPGAATTALGPLLAAGMRIDGTPAVYCADRPGPRFDRYLPMSFALL